MNIEHTSETCFVPVCDNIHVGGLEVNSEGARQNTCPIEVNYFSSEPCVQGERETGFPKMMNEELWTI